MNIRFDGRTAVITGAARGIGRTTALVMAQSGADIIIGDILDDEGLKTCKEIEALGVKAKFVHCDVTNLDDCQKLMKSAPTLDILINCAGIISPLGLLEIDQAEVERVFKVNTIGAEQVVRTAIPIMMERRKGRIMLVESLSARMPEEHFAHYAMSTSAVHSLVMSTAVTVASYGITINGVCPGIIRTQMWEEILDDIQRRTGETDREAIWQGIVKKYVPLGREQTEEDVANTIAFLVSDQGSAIHGQALNVDGGQRSWF